MSTDPACLRAALTLAGMTPGEAAAAITALPAGACARVDVTQPPLGGRRVSMHIDGVSTVGAARTLTALIDHCERVWADSAATGDGATAEQP